MVIIPGIVSALFHGWLVARGLVYPSWEECAQVLAWAVGQLPAGTESELALPPRLAGLSRGGVVQAIRSDNGRTCVLLKRTIGWKGNFTGTLCCDGPLAPEEIVRGHAAYADYVLLRGSIHFNELYVAKRLGERWLHVYFDLN
jgi:hypothetical protein